jgi:hypothetical protein
MEIEEMLLDKEMILDKLLDRNEALAAKVGALEFKVTNLELIREDNGHALRAKDNEIGEFKRLYDAAREEVLDCRSDNDRALKILRELYDAMLAPKGRRGTVQNTEAAAVVAMALRKAHDFLN